MTLTEKQRREDVEKMTIEEAEELVQSWINGNMFTVLKEIETKEDMAVLTLAFIINATHTETLNFLHYVARENI